MLKHHLVAVVTLGISSCAFANIVSATGTAGSYVVHKNVSSNPVNVFFSSASGVPHSFYSPLTISSPGTMNYSSEVATSGVVTVNTPTVWEYQTTFAADLGCFGAPNVGPSTGYAEATLGSSFTVNLDAPGTLQVFSTNTVLNTSVGSPQAGASLNKWVELNGNPIYVTYTDGFISIPLAAGSHTIDFSELALASFAASPLNATDSAFAYGSSRTRFRIESVPEPGTFALGVGLLALVRRRRR